MITVHVAVAFGRKVFAGCLTFGLTHLTALKKAQGDKLGMPQLAKGQVTTRLLFCSPLLI